MKKKIFLSVALVCTFIPFFNINTSEGRGLVIWNGRRPQSAAEQSGGWFNGWSLPSPPHWLLSCLALGMVKATVQISQDTTYGLASAAVLGAVNGTVNAFWYLCGWKDEKSEAKRLLLEANKIAIEAKKVELERSKIKNSAGHLRLLQAEQALRERELELQEREDARHVRNIQRAERFTANTAEEIKLKQQVVHTLRKRQILSLLEEAQDYTEQVTPLEASAAA